MTLLPTMSYSLILGRRNLAGITQIEKVEYMLKYPHIAPEVIHGEHKQSMYAVGKVFRKIDDKNHFSSLPANTIAELKCLFEQCVFVHYLRRPGAERCLQVINNFDY